MKILFDHQAFSMQKTGGISRYFVELISGLKCLEDEPLISVFSNYNRYLNEWDRNRYKEFFPKVSFKGKAKLMSLVNRYVSSRNLKTFDFDVFHPTYYDDYFLNFLGKKPFVLTIHDFVHEKFPNGLSDASTIPERKKKLAHRADKIIAISENTRQDIVEILKIDPEKIITIHHGNSLQPAKVKTNVLPSNKNPYWLYVGSRAEYKNWKLVIKALKNRDRVEDRLILVGGGPLHTSERNFLIQERVQEKVNQVDATDDELIAWYQNAKAFIYPSYYEGFGIPILEAFACGCPVLASSSSSLPEVGGSAALYFDPTDVEALMDRMTTIESDSNRIRLIETGTQRLNSFSWENTVKKTRDVYRELV